ncbi:PREDICTED: basic leucine zipper [Prunus dulcis]|uniref:PREDICTED: basic leucine zipper n=1 Tax=Prunus dulcis TaxID=3755 RepID=A0A5E4FMD6_PRUDU|nr:basic leucine zipper 6 [Prunus dulcis]XP_034203407.1 basic leucine zipper 6 [Prunus dulcis]XP_034203408.1 basic leucine zipper 6 [Prunus dulcis]XP_034203409.1 basic leucine zipper 6 [Prunus dulcis]XP_034203410.1 basic leucine zipper 6 [Prunus dulcis]XP_034203411.1 basic leucine zipper 6 [Prunus dulcis]XP_034203412.1 basic leucine zipper 6 [Prunus dulcis]VVA28251.1 PREDICTED: basic leucine zipper [Prunus dulcis]
MSTRQSHLPPRCPIQKKPNSGPMQDPISLLPHINESYPRHQRSSSQSLMEEQPSWPGNLSNDSESSNKGIVHRRSVSDSVTLLHGLADSFSSLSPKNDEFSVDNGSYSGWNSVSLYGPNSPRQRGSLSISENALVSALSEYASHEPIQNMDGIPCIGHSDSKGDDCHSIGELNAEIRAVKRHPGQRSRIRKLQYIAELERTVGVLQTLESELAVKVASLLQQHVALSMENNKLKQQLARLRQGKFIVDSQYQSLKKEIKRLKIGLTNPRNKKVEAYFGSSSTTEAARVEAMQNLDMGKLTLS